MSIDAARVVVAAPRRERVSRRRRRYRRVVATVLLVDDDAAYRSSLRTFLEASYDLRVVGDTADGREAVDLADAAAAGRCVVDLAMPGVGGLETAQAIAAALPEIVIVVVTGSATVPEAGRAGAPESPRGSRRATRSRSRTSSAA